MSNNSPVTVSGGERITGGILMSVANNNKQNVSYVLRPMKSTKSVIFPAFWNAAVYRRTPPDRARFLSGTRCSGYIDRRIGTFLSDPAAPCRGRRIVLTHIGNFCHTSALRENAREQEVKTIVLKVVCDETPVLPEWM